MKKLFLFAAAALALASCSETDELALNQVAQQNGKGGIQFDVYTQRAVTRAGAPGNAVDGQYGITTESLKNQAPHNVGFGVFAYYTSNSEYDTNSSTPNFMYNQQVKWDGRKSVWTYEPVKYWPNEFGDAANSDDMDKVSFFAYAPYVDFTVNTGVPVVKDGENVDSVQKKNIVGTVKNTTSGDPYIKYIVDTDPATSVDLLWGVAAEQNGYRGLNYDANGDENVIPGNCYIDLTKQIGTTDSIKWNFKHALAQLNIQIISAVDTATQGEDIYDPSTYDPKEYGTNANDKIDSLTKVYLRWIEFGGFVMKGALNLHSEDVETPGVVNAEPNWKGFDGTNELVIENVRFNDGLKEGKEGTTNNIQKTELPVALNPMIIEESFEAEYAKATEEQKAKMKDSWKYKKSGIPTAEYANLFATKDEKGEPASPNAADPIYVIPTGEELTIEGLYDVMTKDEKLAGLLSDNKTHGSAIENKIYKETGVVIEAGKSYVIKIVVGLESVKFSVEVTPWVESSPKENDVDLPFNPGYKAVYQDGKPLVLYLYQGTEEANLNDFKVATLFEKQFVTNVITKADTIKVDAKDYKDYYYFGENFEYRVKKSDLKINTNLPAGSEDTYQISKVEKFDEAKAEFTTSKTDGETETENAYDIYFFSEKLVITAEPAGSAETTNFTISASANPAIAGTITGAGEIAEGETVTLTATPTAGYTFTGWTGDKTGSDNTLSFEATENVNVTANFQGNALANDASYVVKIGNNEVTITLGQSNQGGTARWTFNTGGLYYRINKANGQAVGGTYGFQTSETGGRNSWSNTTTDVQFLKGAE